MVVKWAILLTYYKYAEYDLIIIESENKLKEYIVKLLNDYKLMGYGDGACDNKDTKFLIEEVVKLGNEIVENQTGWGVREIREL